MENQPTSFLKKMLIPSILILGLGIYAGISIIRFKPQLFNLNEIPKDQIEATILSAKVGKLMSLPTDEQPSIETITDLALLKDKPFFINAEVGDKVLIYEKAKIAILYRPSKNIIIKTLSPNYEDAIFSLTPPSPSPTPVATSIPTSVPTPTVEPIISPTPGTTSTASPIATSTPAPIVR